MVDADLDRFIEGWTAASEVYNVRLTDAAVILAFRVLSKHDIQEIEAAISSYLSDPGNGQYPPKPADIVQQIIGRQAQDGRPEADEAWAIAVRSFDEKNTVILNDEIARSLEMSAPIYHDGDKVGARLAFRAAYEREVFESRKSKVPVRWFASLGHDQHARRIVLEEAVKKGLLLESHVQTLLPSPLSAEGAAVAGYLSGKVSELPKNKETANRLKKLRESIK